MKDIDEAIKHCEEVAEDQEDFDKFQCDYCKPGCEDGVWKETCRLPSNIPVGCSWGECSEQNCPLFPGSLECGKEHRQLAEWLKELKTYRNIRRILSQNRIATDRYGEVVLWDDIKRVFKETEADE